MGPSWSKTILKLGWAKHQAAGLLLGAGGWDHPGSKCSGLTHPTLLLCVFTLPLLLVNLQPLQQQAGTLSLLCPQPQVR